MHFFQCSFFILSSVVIFVMLNTRVMLSILLVIEKAVGIVAQLCLTLCTVIWSFLTLECLFGCDYDHCLCLSELFITVMVVVDLTISTNRVSCLERCSLLCVEWDFKPAHSLSSLAINGITYAIVQYKISIWVRPSAALSKKKCYVFCCISAHDDGRWGKESHYGVEWLYAEWQSS